MDKIVMLVKENFNPEPPGLITVDDKARVNQMTIAGVELFWQRAKLHGKPWHVAWIPGRTVHGKTLWEAVTNLLWALNIDMSPEEKALLRAKH